jgi:hypothetical protein
LNAEANVELDSTALDALEALRVPLPGVDECPGSAAGAP